MKRNLLNRRRIEMRSAFTLVELLIVIGIIAILSAIAVPAVMTAQRRAHEFAIQQEMTQIDAAIENFKTKYGFYPPDCTGFTINEFIPFLNRVSPNHGETPTNLTAWYTAVGSRLNPETSLVFWLSGIAKNKQYPLTGGTGSPLTGYNNGLVEREVVFDFDSSRLNINGSVAGYSQARAKGRREPILYFDFDSKLPANYGIAFGTSTQNEPSVLVAPYQQTPGVYFASDRFQLIAPGVDGAFANTSGNTTPVAVDAVRLERDNLTNFAQGPLSLLQN